MSSISPPRNFLSSPELSTRSGLCSPDGKVLSPDIVKRIIEGHEESDIFEECLESQDYADRADLLAQELSKYIQKSNNLANDKFPLSFHGDKSASLKRGEIKLLHPELQTKITSEVSPPLKTTNKEPCCATNDAEEADHGIPHLFEVSHLDPGSKDRKMKKRLVEAEREMVRLEKNLRETVTDLATEKRKNQRCDIHQYALDPPATSSKHKQTQTNKQTQSHNQHLRKKNSEIQHLSGTHVCTNASPAIYRSDTDGDHDTTAESNDTTISFPSLGIGRIAEKRENNDGSVVYECSVTQLTEKFSAELEKISCDREKLQVQFEVDKAKIVAEYEDRIKHIYQSFAAEKTALLKQAERDLKASDFESYNYKEIKALKEKNAQEIKELRAEHQAELGRLRKNIASLEADKAEAGLNFVNQMGDLEQKHRIHISELEQQLSCQSRDLERTQKYVDFLKSDFVKKKECELAEVTLKHNNGIEELKLEYETELKKSKSQHEKAIASMQIAFREQLSEVENNFKKENAALRDKLDRDKLETERRLERENAIFKEKLKLDYERDLAIQLNELRKAGDEYGKYRQEWEEAYKQEKQDLLQNFELEKSDLQVTWHQVKTAMEEKHKELQARLEESHNKERNELLYRLNKQKESAEAAFREEIDKLKLKLEGDFAVRLSRETELLQSTVEHLEKELSSIKYQKKELEARLQVLELKSISQKQEAEEINEFQSEKKRITEKILELQKTIAEQNAESETLKLELNNAIKEKATILDNSVREITDKQEEILRMQNEQVKLQGRIQELLHAKDDADMAARENQRLTKQVQELQKDVQTLSDVSRVNRNLEERIGLLSTRQGELEQIVQDRTQVASRLQDEVTNLQSNLQNMETVHKKESDAQKERLQMTATTASSERSRLIREIQELKESLARANASSERESELKDKIFNDAKAEVMTLNKKLEEKARLARSLDAAVQQLTFNLSEVSQQRTELQRQLDEVKSSLNTHNTVSNSKQGRSTASSDSLVQELYVENAELVRQFQQAESCQRKAEQAAKQLADQKRALQRVISKLCSANRQNT